MDRFAHSSVDCTIRDGDPSDFGPLLRTYPKLTAIGFNGRKAYDLFRKRVMQQERSVWLDRLRVGILPSPSPTPGRYALPLEEKVARWREFLLP
jgi:G:T/U-mismatch repair DNA glycosylase